MKIHHLRDFVGIAQARSVRAAARELGLAQPALTRSLHELETELGMPLLERHARGVTLTDAGHAFFRRAQCAMEELRRGRDEVAQIHGQMSGSVAVGMSSAAWLSLMPDAYKDFRSAFPQIRLRLLDGVFAVLEPRLLNGSLDFIVGPRPVEPLDHGYRVELLFRNELVIGCREGHTHADVTDLNELIETEWLLSGIRPKAEEELQQLFGARGLRSPGSVTRVDSGIGLAILLSSTDAVAQVPHQWLEMSVFGRQIHRIPIADRIAGPDIVQISRAGVPLTPAAERFSTMLKRVAGRLDRLA
ncbi:LysR substrate-binding domain-containing protein [Paraburkholderia fungorum]